MNAFACALVLMAAAVLCSGCGTNLDSCLRFGGGSCCPQLNAISLNIQQLVASQPLYVVLVAKGLERSFIDNVCYTFFPLPDDPKTYILYLSRVFNNGYHDVHSYIVSETETGVRRFGSGECQFTDTLFGRVECSSNVFIYQRCATYGDCDPIDLSDTHSGVVAFSSVRRPISKACLNSAEGVIRNNGLSRDDYITLPMNLPSRCVLNQVCILDSALQRFRQTVGVAFPAINRCATPY